MGSSLQVINDTPAPIFVYVGPAWDVLTWTLTGVLTVATAGFGIAAASVGGVAASAAVAAAGTAAAFTSVSTFMGGTAAVVGLLAATPGFIYSMVDGDPDMYADCLQRQREVRDALSGYTRVEPGRALPQHWGSLSLVQSAVIIDNAGVAFQRKVWTGPTANSNHRYFARKHFGSVNHAGRDAGPLAAVAAACRMERRLEADAELFAPNQELAHEPVGVDSLTGDDEDVRLLAWLSQSFSEAPWMEWAPFSRGDKTFDETCEDFGDLKKECDGCGKCVSCLQAGNDSCPSRCQACEKCNKVQPCLMTDYDCATEEQAGGFVRCLNHLQDEECEHKKHFDSSIQCFLDVFHAHEPETKKSL